MKALKLLLCFLMAIHFENETREERKKERMKMVTIISCSIVMKSTCFDIMFRAMKDHFFSLFILLLCILPNTSSCYVLKQQNNPIKTDNNNNRIRNSRILIDDSNISEDKLYAMSLDTCYDRYISSDINNDGVMNRSEYQEFLNNVVYHEQPSRCLQSNTTTANLIDEVFRSYPVLACMCNDYETIPTTSTSNNEKQCCNSPLVMPYTSYPNDYIYVVCFYIITTFAEECKNFIITNNITIDSLDDNNNGTSSNSSDNKYPSNSNNSSNSNVFGGGGERDNNNNNNNSSNNVQEGDGQQYVQDGGGDGDGSGGQDDNGVSSDNDINNASNTNNDNNNNEQNDIDVPSGNEIISTNDGNNGTVIVNNTNTDISINNGENDLSDNMYIDDNIQIPSTIGINNTNGTTKETISGSNDTNNSNNNDNDSSIAAAANNSNNDYDDESSSNNDSNDKQSSSDMNNTTNSTSVENQTNNITKQHQEQLNNNNNNNDNNNNNNNNNNNTTITITKDDNNPITTTLNDNNDIYYNSDHIDEDIIGNTTKQNMTYQLIDNDDILITNNPIKNNDNDSLHDNNYNYNTSTFIENDSNDLFIDDTSTTLTAPQSNTNNITNGGYENNKNGSTSKSWFSILVIPFIFCCIYISILIYTNYRSNEKHHATYNFDKTLLGGENNNNDSFTIWCNNTNNNISSTCYSIEESSCITFDNEIIQQSNHNIKYQQSKEITNNNFDHDDELYLQCFRNNNNENIVDFSKLSTYLESSCQQHNVHGDEMSTSQIAIAECNNVEESKSSEYNKSIARHPGNTQQHHDCNLSSPATNYSLDDCGSLLSFGSRSQILCFHDDDSTDPGNNNRFKNNVTMHRTDNIRFDAQSKFIPDRHAHTKMHRKSVPRIIHGSDMQNRDIVGVTTGSHQQTTNSSSETIILYPTRSAQGELYQDNIALHHHDNLQLGNIKNDEIAWNEFEVQCSSTADDEYNHNISLTEFDHILNDTNTTSPDRRSSRRRTLHHYHMKDALVKTNKPPKSIHQLLSKTLPSSLFNSPSSTSLHVVRNSDSAPV